MAPLDIVTSVDGWSVGPTSALTNIIARINVTAPAGFRWKVAPRFGDSAFAEAGFTTKLKRLQTGWRISKIDYTFTISTPKATGSSDALPSLGATSTFTVNGKSWLDTTSEVLNLEEGGD